MVRNSFFYMLKPLLPRKFQLAVRRFIIDKKMPLYQDVWPIDREAGLKPTNWSGWPNGKRFAVVLTHDVEKPKGMERCCELSSLEKSKGFRSSFNFVPCRYKVSSSLRAYLSGKGFEIGVHDYKHDGKLFSSQKSFFRCVPVINHYLKEWNAVGFRAGAMHHNLEWIGKLNLKYDLSTFDTDPFEPQPDGVRTIFPFWVKSDSVSGGYVELPYTLPQDFTVFVLLKEKTIDIWKRKLDWIAERGGMALVNSHPDYMHFGEGSPDFEEYSSELYREFLEYVEKKYSGQYWNALPKEVAFFLGENWVLEKRNYKSVA
jgi:hypothetical protein